MIIEGTQPAKHISVETCLLEAKIQNLQIDLVRRQQRPMRASVAAAYRRLLDQQELRNRRFGPR